jgi:Leucine-rich repeat (LRR) protein
LSDVTALKGLTSLTTLDLSNNNELRDVTALKGLTRLTSLNLKHTGVVDVSPLKVLKTLSIER